MNTKIEFNELVLQLRLDVVMEGFDDGALILRLADRHLIEVNPVGQHILELIDGKRSLAQVAGLLAERYAITTAEALQDVLTFCTDLRAQGVLEAAELKNDEEIKNMAEHAPLKLRYLRNPDVVLREEDEDGGLLFNPDTNQVKVVNPTGLFIWQRCDGQHDFDQIAAAMLETYEDAPVDEVRQDLQEYLDGMHQTGFIGLLEE
ncbi:MAG: hypothetical protein B6D39_08930 [Anaerolineae bacterium UTCFX2]|jgi:hypothetical protein|nr:PqqD family peptide modification chaperone [Anaerolineae bacterium]MCZ7552085.1 PqqD family peptide modification chaperone [Anaerolineales bacterium]OQY89891.1 MAG: hypothetical protein B6D39_08930 [Anaerolineae bacterium UTCFX2]